MLAQIVGEQLFDEAGEGAVIVGGCQVRCSDVLAVHHCLGRVPAHIQTTYRPYAELEQQAAVSAGWSRRDLLAGAISIVPAAGLAALPVLADEADPIFAAIEAHKGAMERHEAAVDTVGRLEDELPADKQKSEITAWETRIDMSDDRRWIAALRERQEAGELADNLAWDLVERTPLTTAAGVAALIAYADCEHYGSVREGWFPDGWMMEAYCVAAKTSMRLAGGAS